MTRYSREFNFMDFKLINSYLRMVSYFFSYKQGCARYETRDAPETRRNAREKKIDCQNTISQKRYHEALTCLSKTVERYLVVFSTSPLLFRALMSRRVGVTNLRIVIKLTIETE